MLALSTLAAEAGYIEEGARNALGRIQNARTFEADYEALDRLHGGAFAFLAFHPAADQPVVDYVKQGSLGDDAGPDILVLVLTAGPPPRTPREVRPTDLLRGVSVDLDTHPAYTLASEFFLGEPRPAFPGLVFFDHLATPTQSIYVALGGTDQAQIAAQCRRAFDAAGHALRAGSPRRPIDFDRFAARLAEIDVPYRRAGAKGVRAAALIAGVWIKRHAGALAVIIPKAVDVLTKLKTGGALPTPPA